MLRPTPAGVAPSPAQVAAVALPMLFAPALIALLVTALLEGRVGLRILWARMTQWRVHGRWYALALAVMPLLVLAVLDTLAALVSPAYAPTLALLGSAGVLAGYLEEIGWTGFATPRLLERCSPLLRPWHRRWGASDAEAAAPMPGDDLVPGPAVSTS